jgi:glycosyltransferase involved in cell wall biosynthesis
VKKGFVCMIAYTDYTYDGRVRREAEALAADGFDVSCLTSMNGAGPRQFTMDGVKVRELKVPKYQGKSVIGYLGSYLRFLMASSIECIQLLLKRQLDVVHVHNLPDFLVIAGILPRLAGRKVVLDIHDSMPETFATKFPKRALAARIIRLQERLSAWVAHRVICVNQPQRETLVGRGIPFSKTFICMNVPDPKIFGGFVAERRPAAAGPLFNIVYHGTMAERLGVDLIIRAVAQLRKRNPHVRLHLWGTGDDFPRFHHLVKELGVVDTVLFNRNGFPLQELPQHLRSMDLGVVGNRRSVATDLMLPVKLMEYVSLGIPAVVPRLRTIEHYFSPDMVAFYEPENVEALAAAIERLICKPGLRASQAGQAGEFLRRHGWEQGRAELVTFYRTLVAS